LVKGVERSNIGQNTGTIPTEQLNIKFTEPQMTNATACISFLLFKSLLLVNQREKYHMGPLIRCGGRRSACARAGKRFTYHSSELMAPYGSFLADLPICQRQFVHYFTNNPISKLAKMKSSAACMVSKYERFERFEF
jgi:hypothetical protein